MTEITVKRLIVDLPFLMACGVCNFCNAKSYCDWRARRWFHREVGDCKLKRIVLAAPLVNEISSFTWGILKCVCRIVVYRSRDIWTIRS